MENTKNRAKEHPYFLEYVQFLDNLELFFSSQTKNRRNNFDKKDQPSSSPYPSAVSIPTSS